jgi:hypothetical protein
MLTGINVKFETSGYGPVPNETANTPTNSPDDTFTEAEVLFMLNPVSGFDIAKPIMELNDISIENVLFVLKSRTNAGRDSLEK